VDVSFILSYRIVMALSSGPQRDERKGLKMPSNNPDQTSYILVGPSRAYHHKNEKEV